MSLPYLPLYVADYVLDTPDLTMCQHGAYLRLLMLSWITPGGTMPADDEWVRARLQATPEAFAEHVKPMLDRFFKVKRGRFVSDRLKAEYEKVQTKIAARKEAGKRGGLSKSQNAKEKAASKASVLPVAKPYHSLEPDIEKNTLEAKASKGADAPLDVRKFVWTVGKAILTEAGETPKAAGQAIAALVDVKGLDEAQKLVTKWRAMPPMEAKSYLWGTVHGARKAKAAPQEADPGAAPKYRVTEIDGKLVKQRVAA